MSLPRAYVASGLGFTGAGRHYYQTVLLPALTAVVEVLDPWALVTAAELQAAAEAGPHQQRELGLDIARRNRAAIDSADIVIAHLDGQELDSGTASEVGYAACQNKPVWALREDLRSSGEAGMTFNLQVEGFIEQSGGGLVRSLPELLEAVPSEEDVAR